MLESVFYFVPMLVCLLWAIIYSFRKRNLTQQLLKNIFFLGTFYFLTYAFYISPNTNYLWMCRLDMVNVFVILLLLPFAFIYIHAHLDNKLMPRKYLVLLMIPAILEGTIVDILYFIIGFDRAAELSRSIDELVGAGNFAYSMLQLDGVFANRVEKFYWLMSDLVLQVIILLYFLSIIYMCYHVSVTQGYTFGDIFRFFFKGQPSTPARIVNFTISGLLLCMLPVVALGTGYMISHPLLGIILSLGSAVCLFCTAYVEFLNNVEYVTLKGLTNAHFISDNESASAEAEMKRTGILLEGEVKSDSEESVEGVKQGRVGDDNVVNKADKNVGEQLKNSSSDLIPTAKKTMTLSEHLRVLMDEEEVYKDPSLSLIGLAELLNTNRTTLSGFINTTYGISFKTFLSVKRIECAKQYMLKNPVATLEDVAQYSGFNDSASLCHKFKDVTGMSPKVWLVSNTAN